MCQLTTVWWPRIKPHQWLNKISKYSSKRGRAVDLNTWAPRRRERLPLPRAKTSPSKSRGRGRCSHLRAALPTRVRLKASLPTRRATRCNNHPNLNNQMPTPQLPRAKINNRPRASQKSQLSVASIKEFCWSLARAQMPSSQARCQQVPTTA